MENQEMICSSVQPQPNNPIQIDNGYNNGGEHNGGIGRVVNLFFIKEIIRSGALISKKSMLHFFIKFIAIPQNYLLKK